jgi:D-arabinose 1-dehydrogenase-like Zn-dependent alcohol dehydrogenase
MSYSLNTKCGICEKKDKCTDRHFIEGAISGIHSVYPAVKGHLGSGTVDLNCQNFFEQCSDPK